MGTRRSENSNLRRNDGINTVREILQWRKAGMCVTAAMRRGSPANIYT
jgi:hypothetical protein